MFERRWCWGRVNKGLHYRKNTCGRARQFVAKIAPIGCRATAPKELQALINQFIWDRRIVVIYHRTSPFSGRLRGSESVRR